MKVVFGGVRGTSSVSEPGFMGYGGETTSLLVAGEQGEIVLIDVGTGIRFIDKQIREYASQSSLLLLMTHYHFDHVAGFPSFSILYDPTWSLDIVAPQRSGFNAREVVSSLLAKPFWPLQIDALQAHIAFKRFQGVRSEKPYDYRSLQVTWCPAHHPGDCSAYRIDEPATGASVVIATDIEWGESTEEEKHALIELCSQPGPTDVLIFDGHFKPDEYERFRTWGHSTWQDAIEVAETTGAKQLYITHHAPVHGDGNLQAMEDELKAHFDRGQFARQGVELQLGNL